MSRATVLSGLARDAVKCDIWTKHTNVQYSKREMRKAHSGKTGKWVKEIFVYLDIYFMKGADNVLYVQATRR